MPTDGTETGGANPWGGEPFDGHESSLGFGQSLGEVRGGRERGREPVTRLSDLVFGGKD